MGSNKSRTQDESSRRSEAGKKAAATRGHASLSEAGRKGGKASGRARRGETA